MTQSHLWYNRCNISFWWQTNTALIHCFISSLFLATECHHLTSSAEDWVIMWQALGTWHHVLSQLMQMIDCKHSTTHNITSPDDIIYPDCSDTNPIFLITIACDLLYYFDLIPWFTEQRRRIERGWSISLSLNLRLIWTISKMIFLVFSLLLQPSSSKYRRVRTLDYPENN